MTILQALDSYYARLEGIAEQGWSPEKFGWCILLNRDGDVVDVRNLHDTEGKKPKPKVFMVPAAIKRTAGIAPNFLWDKTAYVLGRTAGEGKRAAQEHAAFVQHHLERLTGQNDEGLVALRLFLERWRPEMFDEAPFRPEMLDANFMFRLDGEQQYLHERPAARAMVSGGGGDEDGQVFCLISGKRGKAARLHPTIKGVDGAQSSGAALVSFNLDAFTSLGKVQGENAPTSETAAFRYGAVLNHLLTRGGPNRVSRTIGDASVVFWAEAGDTKVAEASEQLFAGWLDSNVTDSEEAARIRMDMEAVAKGLPLSNIRPDLEEGTRFHILGLSPNAARLSIRYWMSDTLGHFARNLAHHFEDLRIDPLPLGWKIPPVNILLVRTTALLGKFENIPPLLAGEVMRSVLTGAVYPQSLLATALIRLRAGDPKTKDGSTGSIGWHAAIIRAVLYRQQRLRRANLDVPEKGETPMSLKRDHDNAGYQLGRLFAVYELAQRSALGRVNASIRDRYFGAASATPASVFPLIVRGGQNHLAKVRKEKPGWAALIERELEEIHGRIEPALPRSLPRSLSLQNQGEFAIGYYHQRAAKLSNDKGDELDPEIVATIADEQGDDQ